MNYKALNHIHTFIYLNCVYIFMLQKHRTVTVTDEHDDWLVKHPEINFSGFIRVRLDEYIERVK